MTHEKPIPAPVPAVNPRRTRPPAHDFAGLYVTLAVLNLLIAGGMFLTQAVVLGAIFFARQAGRIRTGQLPFDLITLCGFGLVCAGLTIAGSAGSFVKTAWSRSYIRAGLAGELIVSGVNLLLVALTLGPTHGRSWPLVLLYVVRAGYAGLFLYLYSNLRGDFYFRHDSQSPRTLPTNPMPIDGIPPAPPPPPKRGGRFWVEGFDPATGKVVGFDSNAATEVLARKSAVALGLDPTTLAVTPSDTDGATAPSD